MKIAWPYLLLCVIFWGWTFVATKICLQYVTPVELLGLRFLIGLPFIWLIIKIKRIKLVFDSKDRKSLALGALIITIHFFVQVTGLQYTSATNTGWIIGITPLVMAVLAFFILRERLKRAAIIGVGVATIGILLLVSGGKLKSLGWVGSVGDWLILISAHTWALYTIAMRNVARSRHPLTVTLAVLLPSALLFLGYMLFTSDWGQIAQMPSDGIWAMVFLGLLGLAVAHWFWQEGVARIGASRAGIYLYIEPLATTALAVPMLGEHFGLLTGLGGGLVLMGVFLAEGRHSLSPGLDKGTASTTK